MPWNPAVYNEYKTARYEPFYDLLNLIKDNKQKTVIDLGCGTGELTSKLSNHLPEATILGIDGSQEMLKEADQYASHKISFHQHTIEAQLNSKTTWDLIFSNAALQWVPDHEKLFSSLVNMLNAGGQIAVQMPSQKENRLNILLSAQAAEEPFKTALDGYFRPSPVLKTEDYAELLFKLGGTDIVVLEKIYPLIVNNTNDLYTFILGSALTAYLDRLEDKMKESFIAGFKQKIEQSFSGSPVMYPFKRILFTATFA